MLRYLDELSSGLQQLGEELVRAARSFSGQPWRDVPPSPPTDRQHDNRS